MTWMQEYMINQFGKRTIKALAKKGYTVNDSALVQGKDGTYANGDVYYNVSKGDEPSKGLLYLEVLALVK